MREYSKTGYRETQWHWQSPLGFLHFLLGIFGTFLGVAVVSNGAPWWASLVIIPFAALTAISVLHRIEIRIVGKQLRVSSWRKSVTYDLANAKIIDAKRRHGNLLDAWLMLNGLGYHHAFITFTDWYGFCWKFFVPVGLENRIVYLSIRHVDRFEAAIGNAPPSPNSGRNEHEAICDSLRNQNAGKK